MNMLIQDLRHGFRRLARSPAFAGLLVLSLGLGIGVNGALFRLLDAAVLKSLPARSGEEWIGAAAGGGDRLLATLRHWPERGRPAGAVGGRAGCVHVAVAGIHTTVSFRMARRSGEIGVRVAVGDAGRQPCA